jgi:superfamily II DNA or RNA helicase
VRGDLAEGLRPYQTEAVDAVTAGLGGGGKGQLHTACGTGKTRMAAEARARLVPAGVIVVLVPSIALAAQTLEAWPAGCPVDAAFAVCSDQTVGGTGASGLGVPASTDAGVIAKWLVNATGRVLVTATYDSAHRLDEALRLAGREAEIVVCDEAHVTAGPAGKLAGPVLAEGFLPGRRLFMTATPLVVTGARASGELAVASMDDESAYGPVLYRSPFATAISDGYLKDYRLVVAAVADAQVRELLSDLRLAEDGVPVTMAAAQAALAMAAAAYGLRRYVVFLPRVAEARLFAQTLPRILELLPPDRRPPGPVSAALVHGDMTTVQRDFALARLKNPPEGGWSVVTNARCLGAGIEIPAIDSVVFAAPKESVTDIAQAVGRALRPHGDASTATVIVPALLPAADEDGQPAAGSRWDNVLNVVGALAAHDETLTAELSQARAARRPAPAGQPTAQELPARIIVQAPPGTVTRTLQALSIRIIDGTTSLWWEGYGHARGYHSGHGHLDVPSGYVTPSGYALGGWLSGQRNNRNRASCPVRTPGSWTPWASPGARPRPPGSAPTPTCARSTTSMGTSKSPATARPATAPASPSGATTSGRPPAAARLAPATGNCWTRSASPGTRPKPAGCAATSYWSRPSPATAAPGTCLPDRTRPLGWRDSTATTSSAADSPPASSPSSPRQAPACAPTTRGPTAARPLADLKARNGTLRIPKGYKTPGGLKMANWASKIRARWNAGQLTDQQGRQLEELGFPRHPEDDHWNARCAEARAWHEEHGQFTLPARHPLRDWLYEQRKHHSDGRLPDDKVRQLRDLGVIDDPGPAPNRRDQAAATANGTQPSRHPQRPQE